MVRGDCYNLEIYVDKGTSTRNIKNFLKVREPTIVCLNLMLGDVFEICDDELLGLNEHPFIRNDNRYFGMIIDI